MEHPQTYLAEHYAAKGGDYYSSGRADYVAALPANPDAAILELGCGNGATGALALEQGKCATYVGIEMFEPAALEARQMLSSVHIGNIDTLDLPYAPGSFDALICSEVLEHLVDPEAALRKLVVLLKPGGLVYASSPNIAHWRIVLDLIRGRFDYGDFGIMDRTHLRWFTPSSFRTLFETCGVEVTRLQRLAPLHWAKRLAFGLLGRRGAHLSWYQIDLRGRRVS